MTDDGNPILGRVGTRTSLYPEAWRAAADQLLTDLGFEPGYLSWALARDVVCRAFAAVGRVEASPEARQAAEALARTLRGLIDGYRVKVEGGSEPYRPEYVEAIIAQHVLAFGAAREAAVRAALTEPIADVIDREAPCRCTDQNAPPCWHYALGRALRPTPAAPDRPETPQHPGQGGTHAAARCLVCRARAEGEAIAAKILAALYEYGEHKADCNVHDRPLTIEDERTKRGGCDCGLFAALDAFDDAVKALRPAPAGACPQCGGAGRITVPEHAMSCQGDCRTCPVPADASCDHPSHRTPSGAAPAAGGTQPSPEEVNAIVDECAMTAADWDRLSPQQQVRYILAAARAARRGETGA